MTETLSTSASNENFHSSIMTEMRIMNFMAKYPNQTRSLIPVLYAQMKTGETHPPEDHDIAHRRGRNEILLLFLQHIQYELSELTPQLAATWFTIISEALNQSDLYKPWMQGQIAESDEDLDTQPVVDTL